MANILDDLGITQEELAAGESTTIVKEFQPLKSGVYTAEVKSVYVYENQWGGTQMQYNVAVKDDAGEERLLSYRSDIGKTLKDGSANKGYAGRLKQFAHACNTPLTDISTGSEETIKVFGKDTKAKAIIGFTGKSIKALVRLTNDTAKEENERFKYTNDLQGVVAPDGTEEGGENAAEKFLEQVEKTPVFTVKSKTKAASSATTATTTASGKDIDSML
jgi:hypothetical protein